jgi:flagellar hook-associated protein 1
MPVVNLFNIGKSGLMSSKQSMTTAGHNIANVNTEGFSRQEVQIKQAPTIPSGRLTFGNGAWAHKVDRVSDQYLEKRIHSEHKNFASAEEREIYLKQTEQIFNESNNDGVNRLATRFFNEFRKLSTDPASTAIRASVREASDSLCSEVRRMDYELKTVAKNIDDRIEGYVREVNAMAKEIRDLNLEIEKCELGGGTAPDLHDKRDQAIKRLGAMADISTSRDKTGRVTVTMAGHVAIVAGENVTELEVMVTPGDEKTGKKEDRLDLFIKGAVAEQGNLPPKLTHLFKTGRLGGLLEVRDKDVSSAQDKIDKVAYLIGKEVNNLHRQGFGLDGGNGRNFFKEPVSEKGAAQTFGVSQEILGSLDAIAAAKESFADGDNRMAIALSGLGDVKGLVGDANSSILDVYNSMVSGLAVKTGASSKEMLFARDVLSQLESVRETLVGVNLDEETANLVKLQHSYAANAKVLQVADETMQTVLSTFR